MNAREKTGTTYTHEYTMDNNDGYYFSTNLKCDDNYIAHTYTQRRVLVVV